MPKISVIIPVYNAHDYLGRCLDSVCNQTLKDIEVICVDDCSTDDSLKILREYAAKFPQLKIIAHEKNAGESAARNSGLKAASGDYLGFVDNDDTIDLDFYEKLYQKAVETGSEIVKAEARIFESNGREEFDKINKNIKKYNSKLFFSCCWWTAIYQRNLIEKNNIRFLEGCPLGGDVLFLNQAILKCNKLALVDGTYYNYYRRDDSGDSKVLTLEKVRSVLNVHEKIIENTMNEPSVQNDINGLKHIYGWCFDVTRSYADRNKTEQNLRFCVKKMVKFYSMVKEYLDDNESLMNFYPVIRHYIYNSDEDALVRLFMESGSPQKIFITNLRFLHTTQNQKGKNDA